MHSSRNSQADGMINRFIGTVLKAGVDADGRVLADILWLAWQLQGHEPSAERVPEERLRELEPTTRRKPRQSEYALMPIRERKLAAQELLKALRLYSHPD